MARGNGERRKYWEGLVREHPESGLSVREFCRQRGVKESSFYWWRGTLLGSKTSGTGKRNASQAKRPAPAVASGSPGFVEVLNGTSVSGVRVRLTAGGTPEICLDRGFDETTFRRALAVVAG